MTRFTGFFALLILSLCIATSASAATYLAGNEGELDTAIASAGATDIIELTADFGITGVKDFPSGVTVEGQGHTITATGNLLYQNGTDVVIRDASLITNFWGGWTIRVNGSTRFENCTIQSRIVSWGGQVDLVDCIVHAVIIVGPTTYRFGEPMGNVAGVLNATNCVMRLGWGGNNPAQTGWHEALGLIHNFGGEPAVVNVSHCTIVGATDWVNDRTDNVQMAVFRSDVEDVGLPATSFETNVSNSVIVADASSIFRSDGTGTVTSRYNCNGGSVRNSLFLRGASPGAPAFYSYSPADAVSVDDRTGDIEEFNPFVDVLNGDYRLVASSDAATAAEGGGPLGSDLLIPADVENNAYNLEFDLSDGIDWVLGGHSEELFYGWDIYRGVNDQFFYSTSDGVAGKGMRLEAQDTFDETGGDAHNVYVVQSAYQTFVVKPGYRYTVEVFSRRNASTGYTWADNGTYGNNIIGIADGVEPNPSGVSVSSSIKGAEDTYVQGQVTWEALSNHLTVHLIHRTNGSWNLSDWDSVTISAVPGSQPTGIESYELYE